MGRHTRGPGSCLKSERRLYFPWSMLLPSLGEQESQEVVGWPHPGGVGLHWLHPTDRRYFLGLSQLRTAPVEARALAAHGVVPPRAFSLKDRGRSDGTELVHIVSPAQRLFSSVLFYVLLRINIFFSAVSNLNIDSQQEQAARVVFVFPGFQGVDLPGMTGLGCGGLGGYTAWDGKTSQQPECSPHLGVGRVLTAPLSPQMASPTAWTPTAACRAPARASRTAAAGPTRRTSSARARSPRPSRQPSPSTSASASSPAPTAPTSSPARAPSTRGESGLSDRLLVSRPGSW